MTKTDSAYIGQNRQRNNDGSSVVWPAADNSGALPPLGYNADDLFIGNYGLDTVYVSTDGLTTLTFGASLVGGSFTGTGSDNTVAIPYSGPYLTVAPGSFDKTDPAFRGLIELGYAEPFRDDNTGRIPIRWHSGGSLVHGAHHAPGAVNTPQIHKAHHTRGHFAGGALSMDNAASPGLSVQSTISTGTTDDFVLISDDGTGDGVLAGRYMIIPGGAFPAGWAQTVIHGNVGLNNASNFDSATPGNEIITFTAYFPAMAVATPSSGSLSAGTTYKLRYCFTRVWNGITIESALSPVISLTGSTGYSLALSPLPGGWTGYRVYTDNFRVYTSSTSPVSITAVSSTVLNPSFGFFAWAPGTDTTALPNLMHIGRLSGQKNNHGAYDFNSSVPGLHQGGAIHHAEESISGGQAVGSLIMPDHFTGGGLHPQSHMRSTTTKTGTTPITAHKVPAADGSTGIIFEDPVPAAGSIVDSMIAVGTITGDRLVDYTIHPVKLSMNDLSFSPFDITTGKNSSNAATALSAWTVDVWYYVIATWGTFTIIGPYSQLLAQVTSDATGATGYGDMGPVTYYRGSSGVYTDDPTHPPSGTPPQPLVIAEQADTAELMLTKLTNDYAGTVTLHGWARWRGANRPTKITVNFQLLGVIS